MNTTEHAALASLASRARADGWTRNVTQLLDYFAGLAQAGRLEDLARSFAQFVEEVPQAGAFLFDTLPLVIAASDRRFGRFDVLELEERRPDWCEALSDGLLQPDALDQIVAELTAAPQS